MKRIIAMEIEQLRRSHNTYRQTIVFEENTSVAQNDIYKLLFTLKMRRRFETNN